MNDTTTTETPVKKGRTPIPHFVALPADVKEAQDRLTQVFENRQRWMQGAHGMNERGSIIGLSPMKYYAENGHFPENTFLHGSIPHQACLMGGVAVVTDSVEGLFWDLSARISRAINEYMESDHPDAVKHRARCFRRHRAPQWTEFDRQNEVESHITSFNDCEGTRFTDIKHILRILRTFE